MARKAKSGSVPGRTQPPADRVRNAIADGRERPSALASRGPLPADRTHDPPTSPMHQNHPIVIRAAEPDDVDALLRIETAAFPGDHLTRRNFRHAVASPSIVALVAGEPVRGYALAETRRNARVARLSSIAVGPGAEGAGIGCRLAGAIEQAVRLRGCDRLRLEVRADNARAIALYERRGYRRIGRIRRYYDDGTAALKLEKALG